MWSQCVLLTWQWSVKSSEHMTQDICWNLLPSLAKSKLKVWESTILVARSLDRRPAGTTFTSYSRSYSCRYSLILLKLLIWSLGRILTSGNYRGERWRVCRMVFCSRWEFSYYATLSIIISLIICLCLSWSLWSFEILEIDDTSLLITLMCLLSVWSLIDLRSGDRASVEETGPTGSTICCEL